MDSACSIQPSASYTNAADSRIAPGSSFAYRRNSGRTERLGAQLTLACQINEQTAGFGGSASGPMSAIQAAISAFGYGNARTTHAVPIKCGIVRVRRNRPFCGFGSLSMGAPYPMRPNTVPT